MSGESGQLSELVRNILQDLSRILRAELRLARTELAEKGVRAGTAVGILSGAAVAGLLAASCFVTTCIAALCLVMPLWLAALLMGILLTFFAAGAFAIGRTRLSEIDALPQRTAQTLRDDVEWAKHRIE